MMEGVARTSKDTVTLPRSVLEGLIETLDALSQPGELEAIRRGLDDIRGGRLLTEEPFLARHPRLRKGK